MRVSTVNLDNFLKAVESTPSAARKAAVLSTNDTVRRARAMSAKEIMKQVAFPGGYLGNVNNGRLRVSKYAKGHSLSAEITGRFNPTSLAQFTTNKPSMIGKNRRGPARVKVKPGSVQTIERAFIMRLRRGSISAAAAGSSANLGLAIRLAPGERVHNKKAMKTMGRGLYLLYGPSVNQVFKTVSEDIQREVGRYYATEFSRQFRRLSNGG